jgi:tetratricopeptide (TPR) repeat protein
LNETLLAVRPDGPALYAHDRDSAFQWFYNKGFSIWAHLMDPNTLKGARFFESMSRRADSSSLWHEAWAGYHHTLAGYLHLNIVEKVSDILWRLGRAHTGLGRFELAGFYLESTRLLSEAQHKTELTTRVISEQAVLAIMSEQKSAYSEAMERLSAILFPFGNPSSTAPAAALTLFQEGKKNQEWRRDGRPIKSCQIHAIGFYEVSLDLNRRLDNRQAVGITLFNLGDVYKDLGKNDKAGICWQESLQYFEEPRDNENIELIRERLK